MKFYFLITTFFSAFGLGYSQNRIISGEVRNYQDNKSLTYVNIGIKNKTVGTVSDKNGLFVLILNDQVTSLDTVVFSYIGFNIEKYPISGLAEIKGPILLRPKNMELDEVVVISKKISLKPKEIGRSSKGLGLTYVNFYSYYEKDVDDRLSKERGMKFKIRRNCHIKDINELI